MPKTSNPKSNRLWIARKRAGLAQKSVARFLGHKTASTISEYEKGRLLPSLPTALRLAAIYQESIRNLYPELYREIHEEVESIKKKQPININQRNVASNLWPNPFRSAF